MHMKGIFQMKVEFNMKWSNQIKMVVDILQEESGWNICVLILIILKKLHSVLVLKIYFRNMIQITAVFSQKKNYLNYLNSKWLNILLFTKLRVGRILRIIMVWLILLLTKLWNKQKVSMKQGKSLGNNSKYLWRKHIQKWII